MGTTDLYRVSKVSWAVKYFPQGQEKAETISFATIEQAADFLEQELHFKEEEVNQAIIEMTINGHNHAQFGVMKGNLIYTDCEQLGERVGMA